MRQDPPTWESPEALEARLGIDRVAIGTEAFICVDDPVLLHQALPLSLTVPANPAIGWTDPEAVSRPQDLQVYAFEDTPDGRVAAYDQATRLVHTLRFGRDLDAGQTAHVRDAPGIITANYADPDQRQYGWQCTWDVFRIGMYVAMLTCNESPFSSERLPFGMLIGQRPVTQAVDGSNCGGIGSSIYVAADLPMRSAAMAALQRLQTTAPLYQYNSLQNFVDNCIFKGCISEEVESFLLLVKAARCSREPVPPWAHR